MKNVLLATSLVALTAFCSSAEATEAMGSNIAGTATLTCRRGQPTLATLAFHGFNASPRKAQDVFGKQLPDGTTVFAFDPANNNYIRDCKIPVGGWSDNILFKPGMGFWIRVPSDAPKAVYDVTLTGEVSMQPATTNDVINGMSLLGLPYAASMRWTETEMARNANPGDKLFIHDPKTGTYDRYVYSETDEWGKANDLIITQTMGFWYQSTATASVTSVESRPYPNLTE